MKLGILYKDSRIVNHRSLLKVVANPIFRTMGFHIATVYYPHKEKLGRPIFMKTEMKRSFEGWNFKCHNDFDTLVKKRIIL